ncbi:YicC family protein [candidate division WOR-3 bacterium]|nr:YicC family protein [candidate division WOR-3 bacterium]
MPKSMTGFAFTEQNLPDGTLIAVTLKSLNHRYLDISLNAPKEVSNMEIQIAGIVKRFLSRGRVTLTVTIKNPDQINGGFYFDEKTALSTLENLEKLRNTLNIIDPVRIEHILSFSLMQQNENPVVEKSLWNILEKTIEKALIELVERRTEEGSRLAETILLILDQVEIALGEIEKIAPFVTEERKAKLLSILSDSMDSFLSARKEILDQDRAWLKTFIEARILTEISFLADKITIQEEIDRLKIHLRNFRETLLKNTPVGKTLDFIIQEINRETNTIASKAQKAEISIQAVKIKENLENIREQVQNLE